MHVERERAFFLGNAPALQGASAAGLVWSARGLTLKQRVSRHAEHLCLVRAGASYAQSGGWSSLRTPRLNSTIYYKLYKVI
jgi:hypothetical protein